MSKINKIQAAILALEGGAYQKLLDEYLYRKYHLENIQPLGVQNATNKTTKGIPDSYVLTGDKYVLICYGTVKEQPANKIKTDISDCLDTAKTKLPLSKISRILCCYTSSNITPEQTEMLKTLGGDIDVELIGLGTLSHDLAYKYKNLAKDHLDISIDTHQVFVISDFVELYDQSGTNAPIDTKLCFRSKELEQVEDSLDKHGITILSGPSGIGKTRLALEVCRRFEKKGWTVFCIRSNGRLLYEDLEDYLDEKKKYLLFFDDANTVTQINNILEACLTLANPEKVKILLTIRDYAKRQITKARQNTSTEEVVLGAIKDDEIKSILKENYGILNHEYLDKICRVAKGNIRLAVLAGIRAKESGLPSINNAEDIFKNYYGPIIDKMNMDKTDLVLLGIIAYIGAVRTTENEFYQELVKDYLGDENIVDHIEKLYSYEMIDWYEKEIIKLADQSFGNFILYLVVYEKEWLGLGDLIERSIPEHTKQIVNLINLLLSSFRTDELSDRIKKCVNNTWDKADQNLQQVYLQVFYPLNPVKGLMYVKQFVDTLETKEYDLHLIDFERERNINTIKSQEVEILAGYKQTNCYEEAISLLLMLYEKRPEWFMDFYFAITNYLLYDKYSYRTGYSSEISLLKRIWGKCQDGKNFNYSVLFIRIAEYALRTEFTYTESNGGRTFSIVTMMITVNDELRELRTFVWQSLMTLCNNAELYDMAISVIKNIRVNGLCEADHKSLCRTDFEALYAFLVNETPVPFEKARILGMYKDAFVQLGIEVDDRFSVLDDSREYKIYKTLSKDYFRDCSLEESERRRRKEIGKLIQNYSVSDYFALFKTCKYLEPKLIDTHKLWGLQTGVLIVFSLIEGDQALYLSSVDAYLSNGAPFDIRPTDIVCKLLSFVGYNRVKELVLKSQNNCARKWYGEVLSCISSGEINEVVDSEYLNFQNDEFLREDPIILPLRYAKRFSTFDGKFLDLITTYLLEHPKYIYNFLELARDEEDVQMICDAFANRVGNLIDLYFACDNSLFDYEEKLLWAIYAKSPIEVWKRYVDEVRNEKRIHQREFTAFAHIWETSEYSERIDYAFSELIAKEKYYIDSHFALVFANKMNDPYEERKKDWIRVKMLENVGNIVIINKLLDIVTVVYPSWKTMLLVEYLKYDMEIEHFKKLHLLPMSESWSGSYIPLINRKIALLEELKSALVGLEYLEHKLFLDELIAQKEQQREEFKKREYLEDSILGG